jgi:hypothetical protein
MTNQEQSFELAFAKQLEAVQAAVEQNRQVGLAFGAQEEVAKEKVCRMRLDALSLQPTQQPGMGLPTIYEEENPNDRGDDSDSEDNYDDNDEVEAEDGEFVFSGKVFPGSDDEDYWSEYSSDAYSWEVDFDDDEDQNRWFVNFSNNHGGYLHADLFTGEVKTVYRFAMPNPHTTCNAAAAALTEPVSLLTKYRFQRLAGDSDYFSVVLAGPQRSPRHGSPLKK